MPIEVSPIAHYHMGGIRVDKKMATRVTGLFAAGEAVGAKFISYDALRGSYDFIVVFEGTFEQAAGVKLATEATGALKNINICEAIQMSGPATQAVKIAATYKAPGK